MAHRSPLPAERRLLLATRTSSTSICFGSSLQKYIVPYVIGYGLELWQNGVPILSKYGGWAIEPWDAPPGQGVLWSPTTPQDVASVSKLITATAMLRVLQDRVISQDRLIYPFLPSYWNIGPGIDAFPSHSGGWNSGDLTTGAGAGGWHLTVPELMQFMQTLMSGKILPVADVNTMIFSDFEGVDPYGTYVATPSSPTTGGILLVDKGGSWSNGNNSELAIAFPSLPDKSPTGMQMAMLINSSIGSSPYGPASQSLVNVFSQAIPPVSLTTSRFPVLPR